MADERVFSIGKLVSYSTQEVEEHMKVAEQRASRLSELQQLYNDEVRRVLNASGQASAEILARSTYWSNMRDSAASMAEETVKKRNACRVELDLRKGGI